MVGPSHVFYFKVFLFMVGPSHVFYFWSLFVYGGSLTCVSFLKSFCLWWVPHMCFTLQFVCGRSLTCVLFLKFLFMVGPSHAFWLWWVPQMCFTLQFVVGPSHVFDLTVCLCLCKTHGFRTFALDPMFGIRSLQDFRHCSTLSSFKAKLKTFLFSQYFGPN